MLNHWYWWNSRLKIKYISNRKLMVSSQQINFHCKDLKMHRSCRQNHFLHLGVDDWRLYFIPFLQLGCFCPRKAAVTPPSISSCWVIALSICTSKSTANCHHTFTGISQNLRTLSFTANVVHVLSWLSLCQCYNKLKSSET